MNDKLSALLSALVIAAGLVLSTFIGARTFERVKSNNTISVTGSAERTVTSDTVKWTGSFSRTVALDGLKDGNAAMKSDLDAILKFLRANGVTDAEITVQPSTIMPTCEGTNPMGFDKFGGQNCGSNKTVGYALQQALVVESKDVKKITTLAQEAPSRLDGIVFATGNLEYYVSAFSDLKLEMLTEATKNAKQRAERILEATGSALGGLQTAGMGVFQVTSVNSTDVSDYGMYDTSSIDKKVTAVVRASFFLK